MNNPTLNLNIKEKEKQMTKENYPVLIVGASGSGKSFSTRNLPPEDTVYLNIERKPLPFTSSLNVIRCQNPVEFDKVFPETLKSDKKIIVIDSLTKYLDLSLAYSKTINKGYDIYNWYNDKISFFVQMCNGDNDKVIFVLSIDEVVKIDQVNGSTIGSKRAWCDGKRWEGKIEREFTCVLFTQVTNDKGVSKYQFITNGDGTNSAKSPYQMFSTNLIANDCLEVYQAIQKRR